MVSYTFLYPAAPRPSRGHLCPFCLLLYSSSNRPQPGNFFYGRSPPRNHQFGPTSLSRLGTGQFIGFIGAEVLLPFHNGKVALDAPASFLVEITE